MSPCDNALWVNVGNRGKLGYSLDRENLGKDESFPLGSAEYLKTKIELQMTKLQVNYSGTSISFVLVFMWWK